MELSTLNMSDLSCLRTRLCLRRATCLPGNMTLVSKLKVGFNHMANEKAAMNTAEWHRLHDVSNICYPWDTCVSIHHCQPCAVVEERSTVHPKSVFDCCFHSGFGFLSLKHVTEWCSVWMKTLQLAFMLLGPEAEAELSSKWNIEVNFLHYEIFTNVSVRAILTAGFCIFVQGWV